MENPLPLIPLLAAVVLATLHLLAGRLRFLEGIPRSRWLSAAGGVSVAYVMVHLLPELAEYQEAVSETSLIASLERHVYVLALIGLAVFYGVERYARVRQKGDDNGGGADAATTFSFASYAVYNAIIGYLLVHREGGLIAFAVAMGLHFIVNDQGLRDDHRDAYHQYGRWVVSAAIIGGALIGAVAEVAEPVVGLLLAFIGGGVILNVLKEELPEERDSRFAAFVSGAAIYTAVLLVA